MAFAKKKSRKIVVNNIGYIWKFTGKIVIEPQKNTHSLLVVDFGWYDIFDYIHLSAEERPPSFEPLFATPKFVAAAISFAVKNNWQNGVMNVLYKDSTFSIQG